MPKLAAFAKGFIKQLVSGEMSVYEWIDLADGLRVDGLEFYFNYKDLQDKSNWSKIRSAVEAKGMTIPMMCASPDFTIPDYKLRQIEIEKEISAIEMSAALGRIQTYLAKIIDKPDVAESYLPVLDQCAKGGFVEQGRILSRFAEQLAPDNPKVLAAIEQFRNALPVESNEKP